MICRLMSVRICVYGEGIWCDKRSWVSAGQLKMWGGTVGCLDRNVRRAMGRGAHKRVSG